MHNKIIMGVMALRRMYNPYVYRRKQYTGFSIVLLAVLIYVILEKTVFTSSLTPIDPDEFTGTEDATDDKD